MATGEVRCTLLDSSSDCETKRGEQYNCTHSKQKASREILVEKTTP